MSTKTSNAQPVAATAEKAVLTTASNTGKNSTNETAPKQTFLSLSTEMPVSQKNEMDVSCIMEKAEKLHLLSLKYGELTSKRKSLDLFAISHDKDNAQLQLADANGLSFESCNPKCIKKVIEIWKEEFSMAIKEIEKQMRELMSV